MVHHHWYGYGGNVMINFLMGPMIYDGLLKRSIIHADQEKVMIKNITGN